MNAKNKRITLKILPYPIIFVIGGILYVFIEIGILGTGGIYPSTGAIYDPVTSAQTILIMTFILGLFFGLIEEMIFKNDMVKIPFGLKIILKTVVYVGVFTAVQFVFAIIINVINLNKTMIDAEVIGVVVNFFSSFTLVSIIIYAGFIINLSLFFSEIVDYLGIDIVGNFFSGKYSKPVYENRIFMFLDMKDSTTIAEKIGHEKQHELINEYYSDMSEAILKTNGSIYQYVGDEIVVSWKMEEGLKDCNCIQCFFLILECISGKSQEYREKYGLIPEFKAGLHFGEVTRGQVGKIKRDLLFVGDVLNATARIQALCNELESPFLISCPLKNELPENDFQFRAMGEFELKGRVRKEELFAVI